MQNQQNPQQNNQKKSKLDAIKRSKIWAWKHFILLGVAITIFMLGVTIGSLQLILFGLIMAAFGLAIWYGAIKSIVGLVSKAHDTTIAKYGVPDRFSSVTKISENDLINAILYGDKDEKKDRYFHGISLAFNRLNPSITQKDHQASIKQLQDLYVAYNKGKGTLKDYFETQIRDYIEKRIESENKFRRERGQDEKIPLVDDPVMKKSSPFTTKEQEQQINRLATNMATIFSNYLNMSPNHQFAPEDFSFNNMGMADDKGKDYFDDYLRNELSKTRASRISYGFIGAAVGALGALGAYLATVFNYKIYSQFQSMYQSIGLGGFYGIIGLALGIVIGAAVFTIAAHLYNKHQEKIPKRLDIVNIGKPVQQSV